MPHPNHIGSGELQPVLVDGVRLEAGILKEGGRSVL
jgi:hypothetical protein